MRNLNVFFNCASPHNITTDCQRHRPPVQSGKSPRELPPLSGGSAVAGTVLGYSLAFTSSMKRKTRGFALLFKVQDAGCLGWIRSRGSQRSSCSSETRTRSDCTCRQRQNQTMQSGCHHFRQISAFLKPWKLLLTQCHMARQFYTLVLCRRSQGQQMASGPSGSCQKYPL
jgi:hypothetical protein